MVEIQQSFAVQNFPERRRRERKKGPAARVLVSLSPCASPLYIGAAGSQPALGPPPSRPARGETHPPSQPSYFLGIWTYPIGAGWLGLWGWAAWPMRAWLHPLDPCGPALEKWAHWWPLRNFLEYSDTMPENSRTFPNPKK